MVSLAYEYRTPPFKHQRRLFDTTSHLPFYGLLWEQGTGKTKPIIDMAALLYEEKEIDCLLVVAPPGVERNWITDEIPVHMPERVLDETWCFYYASKKAGQVGFKAELERAIKWEKMLVVVISYHAVMTDRGRDFIWRVLRRRRCLYVVDEAHHIKTPKTKRATRIIRSGKYAPYRRILTGTPVSIGPFDIYAQIRFLDDAFWRRLGMDTFAAFKQHFGIWLTRAEAQAQLGYDPGYDKLIEYKNVPELAELLASISDRVLKTDVLDLPPQLYSKRYFEMNQSQTRAYAELKKEFVTELDNGKVVEANLAIVRLLRLQQITCGYVGDGSEDPVTLLGNKNPRLDLVEDLRDGLGHPAIFWARFTRDIDQMMDILGPRAVRYDGAVSDDECARSKQAFNAGDAEWFVGNAQKGGEGITLNAAKSSVYYSNSFKLIDRLQSEARPHRAGQEGAYHEGVGFGVHNIDIQCPGTVDGHITRALRNHFNIAADITGDQLREWI